MVSRKKLLDQIRDLETQLASAELRVVEISGKLSETQQELGALICGLRRGDVFRVRGKDRRHYVCNHAYAWSGPPPRVNLWVTALSAPQTPIPLWGVEVDRIVLVRRAGERKMKGTSK